MEILELRFWLRMEKVKWSEKVTTEVLEPIKEKHVLLGNILCENTIGLDISLKINSLLRDSFVRQMTEVSGVGRRRM